MLQKKWLKVIVLVGLIAAVAVTVFFLRSHGPTATPDHITLTWTGDVKTTQTVTWRTEMTMVGGQVQYAEAMAGKSFPSQFETMDATVTTLSTNGGDMSIHTATLIGLKPGTPYIYRVGDGVRWSRNHTFSTSPSNVSQFKFLIFPDSQSNYYHMWSRTPHQAYKEHPDAVFMTNVGDLVDVGLDYGQWNGWFEAGQGVIDTIPVMPVAGNHENYTPQQGLSMPVLFTGQFKLPTNGPKELKGQVYSFDYGDVHFSVLDSQEGEEESFVPTMMDMQKLWLESDLQTTDKQWKIVFIHRPPYHNRPNEGDEHLRLAFVPLFDKYHVDMVFSGHDHVYARSYPLRGGMVQENSLVGTIYITTGRSGTKTYSKALAKDWNEFFYNPEDAPNYLTVEVAGSSLTVKAFKQSGMLIDEKNYQKPMK